MSISIKDKELVAIGVSVAAGCKPCTNFHLKAASKAGRSRDEVRSVVTIAGRVRNEATEIMVQHALTQPVSAAHSSETRDADRIAVLTAVGAAFAVNCTTSLAAYLEAAERIGLASAEVAEVVELARFIKQMGASHVEKMVEADGTEFADSQETGVTRCGC